MGIVSSTLQRKRTIQFVTSAQVHEGVLVPVASRLTVTSVKVPLMPKGLEQHMLPSRQTFFGLGRGACKKQFGNHCIKSRYTFVIRLKRFQESRSLPVQTASWPSPPAEFEESPAGLAGRCPAPGNHLADPLRTSHSQDALVCSCMCTQDRPSPTTVHTETDIQYACAVLGHLQTQSRCRHTGMSNTEFVI